MDQPYFGHKLAVNKEHRGVYSLHYSIDICMILRGYWWHTRLILVWYSGDTGVIPVWYQYDTKVLIL
jgi:hypothetical protein